MSHSTSPSPQASVFRGLHGLPALPSCRPRSRGYRFSAARAVMEDLVTSPDDRLGSREKAAAGGRKPADADRERFQLVRTSARGVWIPWDLVGESSFSLERRETQPCLAPCLPRFCEPAAPPPASVHLLQHWSVDMWRTFYPARWIDSLDNDAEPLTGRMQAFAETLTSAVGTAGIFSSGDAARYWAYHLGRTGFLLVQGLVALLAARSAIGVNAQSGAMSRMEETFRKGWAGPVTEALLTYYQDYTMIKEGERGLLSMSVLSSIYGYLHCRAGFLGEGAVRSQRRGAGWLTMWRSFPCPLPPATCRQILASVGHDHLRAPPVQPPVCRAARGGVCAGGLRNPEAEVRWLFVARCALHLVFWEGKGASALHRQAHGGGSVHVRGCCVSADSTRPPGPPAPACRDAGKAQEMWLRSPSLPDYFQSTFHYQTDGWMSAASARVYETSTETLFVGRQDAMQRTTLVHMHDFMAGEEERGAEVAGGGSPPWRLDSALFGRPRGCPLSSLCDRLPTF